MGSYAFFASYAPEHIMLRAPNWLGDCIMAVPGMKAFRQHYADARISVAGQKPLLDLYASQPWCDSVVPVEQAGGIGGLHRSFRSIKQCAFDMAVVYPNSFRSALETFLARIPVRLGYARDGRSLLLTHRVQADRDIRTVHQVLYYMRLAHAVIKADPKPAVENRDDVPVPQITVTEQARETARNILRSRLNADPQERKPAVWAPGAAYGPAKQWPEEHVVRTVKDLFSSRGIQTVLTGSPAEKDVCGRIEESAPEAAVSVCGETGLAELSGIISWACLFAGNDSGASHLAAALGVPVLVLFGSTSPAHTMPRSPDADFITLDLECSPCMKRRCPLKHRKCLYDITPEMVIEKIGALL